jgi:phospholipid/cholesterol/gamma-HCH transport system ATP-binding protein
VIEVRQGLCREGRRAVFADLDLSIAHGEILGLIGPTLSGKTTLLRVLAGLRPLDEGELRIEGRRLDGRDSTVLRGWQRRVGMSFQENALFDERTAFDNVALPLRIRKVKEDDVRAAVSARLEQVGLGAHADKLPHELSFGMRRRVGIARATVHEPDLGLFDDPTAGLDPLSSAQIMALIAEQARTRGMTAIVVSHDLAALSRISERVVMLAEGGIVFDGTASQLHQTRDARIRDFCLR